MEQRLGSYTIFKYLLFLYVVATGFQNLLNLPQIGNKIQLPELLFPFLLLFFPYSILSTIRLSKRQRILGFSLVTLLLIHVISFAVTGNGLMEVAGKFYLFLLFSLLIFYFTSLSKTELVAFVSNSFFMMGSVLAVFSLVGYLMAAWGVENRFVYTIHDYPYFGTILRLCGPTFTPTMLITLLSCSILFSVGNGANIFFSRLFRNSMLFLMGLACILTFSKSIVILGLCLLLSFFQKRLHFPRPFMLVSISFTILLVTISTHLLIVPDDMDVEAKYGSTPFVSSQKLITIGQFNLIETTYLTLKRTALSAFAEHPFFGLGPGAFNHYVAEQQEAGRFPAKIPTYDPHSTYIGALAETGILGLLVLLCFLFLICQGYSKIYFLRQDSFRGSIFLVLLFFLIEGISTDMMNFRHIWIVFAIAFVYLDKQKEDQPDQSCGPMR